MGIGRDEPPSHSGAEYLCIHLTSPGIVLLIYPFLSSLTLDTSSLSASWHTSSNPILTGFNLLHPILPSCCKTFTYGLLLVG